MCKTLPQLVNREAFGRTLARECPALLRGAGEQGTARVRFRIEVDGTVSHVTILQSTRPEFVEPTLRSIRTMRFAPARIGGRPVRVWVEQPIMWTVGRRPPRQADDRTDRPMFGRPRR